MQITNKSSQHTPESTSMPKTVKASESTSTPSCLQSRHVVSASNNNEVTQHRCALIRKIKIAIFSCVLLGIIAVCYAHIFSLYAPLAQVSWNDFREAPTCDTVIVGSSYAERGINPLAYDDARAELSGEQNPSTYNLATPGQVLSSTYDTVLEAIEHKHVKRVILGIGLYSLDNPYNVRAEVPYLYARYQHDPITLAQKLGSLALRKETFGAKDSLNVYFPWVFTPARTPQALYYNVMSRLTHEPYGLAAQKVTKDWTYGGRGYGNYNWALEDGNYDTSAQVYGWPRLNQKSFEYLEQIARLCQDRGVSFICIATPHPAFDIAAFGSFYPKTMKHVRDIVEGANGVFLDCNMCKEGVLSLSRSEFADFEHLNTTGAQHFSRYLAKLIYRIDMHEDVSQDFISYDEWDTWMKQYKATKGNS